MVNEEQYFEDLEDLEGVGDEDYAFFEASQCIVKGDATYSYALDNTLPEDGQTELYEHRRVVADSGQNPVRVDKFLMDHLRDTSRNRIPKAAEAGYIMANGKPVKSNYKVKAGDVITLMFDRPKRDWEIIPEDIPLNIVYEDDQILLIDKPAGLVVHPGCGNYTATLVKSIAWHLRDNPDYDPNDPSV